MEIADYPYRDKRVLLDIKDIPAECRYDDMAQEFYSYIVGEKQNPFSFEHELLLKKIMDKICFENIENK